MALTKCKECGNTLSTTAKSCPQCGAKPIKTSAFTWLVAIIAASIMIGSFSSGPTAPNAPSAPKTPERSESEARFKKVGEIGAVLMSGMREPDTVEWTRILANKDASVVCFEFKGKNGFGGVSFNKIAVVNGRVRESTSQWNAHCANKVLFDETLARGNIASLYRVLRNF